MTRSPLVEAAADYLSRGLAVIALTGKTPNVKVHKHGLHEPLEGAPDCDADYELLASVFDHPDTTGIGILTRWPYVVVDIDGEEGAKEWAELLDADPTDPHELYDTARWVAKTGRGLHLWYGSIQKTGTIKLGTKLDLKGEGGYVAAPPSRHPDGHTYEWLIAPGAEAPFEAPEPLARRIEDHVFDAAFAMENKRVRAAAWGPKFAEGDHVFYAQASHDSLIENMKTAVEGNRNAYLHWAAATLSEEGGSDDEFEALAAAALGNGLERVEVKRTIRSARRARGED